MNLVVSFFIVIPSFEFATASPIRTLILQLACHRVNARKVLKTRACRADLRHFRPELFTAVNSTVHQHPSLPAMG